MLLLAVLVRVRLHLCECRGYCGRRVAHLLVMDKVMDFAKEKHWDGVVWAFENGYGLSVDRDGNTLLHHAANAGRSVPLFPLTASLHPQPCVYVCLDECECGCVCVLACMCACVCVWMCACGCVCAQPTHREAVSSERDSAGRAQPRGGDVCAHDVCSAPVREAAGAC